MLTVYGIKDCDTVKTALNWLEAEGVDHVFHDFRAEGLDEARVARWVEALGWESVLNKRSTTWRELADADKDGLDAQRAITLMMAHPTLIKRPVFEGDGFVLSGFTDKVRAHLA